MISMPIACADIERVKHYKLYYNRAVQQLAPGPEVAPGSDVAPANIYVALKDITLKLFFTVKNQLFKAHYLYTCYKTCSLQ